MKNIVSLIVMFLLFFTLSAQEDVLFQSTLYFEDAIGNKDSIVYGFAENEEINLINPFYGEKEINTPFDSVFEVRASHDKLIDEGFSKKIITHVIEQLYNENYACFELVASPFFIIHAKHYPIKISWNPDDFKDRHCIEGSMIVGHAYPFMWDDWFTRESFLTEATCLATDSTLYRLDNDMPWDYFNNIEIEIEGNTTAKGNGLFIMFRDDSAFGGMCKAEGTNSVNRLTDLPSLFPYPNPVSDVFHFGLQLAQDFEIVDLHGRVVLTGTDTQAEVQNLANGIYYLIVEGYAPQRFVKM